MYLQVLTVQCMYLPVSSLTKYSGRALCIKSLVKYLGNVELMLIPRLIWVSVKVDGHHDSYQQAWELHSTCISDASGLGRSFKVE